jgi:hypothetical protein
MKFATLENRNDYGHKGGDYNYTHLLLETPEDVLAYNKILANRNAQTNTDLWFGFKGQNFRQTISDYMIHEATNISPETIVLGIKLQYKQTDTSLMEYCEMSDNIVSDKCQRILNHINNGHIVRINHKGGYCYINEKDYNDYDTIIENVTEEQLISFIYFGKLENKKYTITNPTVIIENDNSVAECFTNRLILQDIDPNLIDKLTNFKNTIRTYTDEEIVKLFVDGINNGLKNICFETSGQDLHQIRKMCILLEKVVALTKVEIKLYISCGHEDVFDIFSNFEVINIDKYF